MPQMSQVLRERAIGMPTAGMSTKAVARELNAQTTSHLQRCLREFGSTFNQPSHFREELTDLCASLLRHAFCNTERMQYMQNIHIYC